MVRIEVTDEILREIINHLPGYWRVFAIVPANFRSHLEHEHDGIFVVYIKISERMHGGYQLMANEADEQFTLRLEPAKHRIRDPLRLSGDELEAA